MRLLPSPLVCVSMVAARVLTILMHFSLSKSLDADNNKAMPLNMVRRNYINECPSDILDNTVKKKPS